MSKRLQWRRGTTSEINAFTGAVGEVAYDIEKKTLVTQDGSRAGGFPLSLGCWFCQTANATVANTTTETSMAGVGAGSNTFPANFFVPGRTIEIHAAGFISGVNGDRGTVRVYFGGTKLIESVGIMPTTFTDAGVQVRFMITYRGNNKFIGQGYTIILAGQAFATSYFRSLMMTSEIDKAVNQENTLSITYQWDAAKEGNPPTISNCTTSII